MCWSCHWDFEYVKNAAIKQVGKNDTVLIPVLNTFKITTFPHLEYRNNMTAGADPGGTIGTIAPPKTYESNFFTMILYNSENNIRDIRPLFRQLFCHRSAVNLWSTHLFYHSEAVMKLDCQVLLKSPTLNSLAGSAPAWLNTHSTTASDTGMQRQDKAYVATCKLSANCVANAEIKYTYCTSCCQCKNKNAIEIDMSNISFCV